MLLKRINQGVSTTSDCFCVVSNNPHFQACDGSPVLLEPWLEWSYSCHLHLPWLAAPRGERAQPEPRLALEAVEWRAGAGRVPALLPGASPWNATLTTVLLSGTSQRCPQQLCWLSRADNQKPSKPGAVLYTFPAAHIGFSSSGGKSEGCGRAGR